MAQQQTRRRPPAVRRGRVLRRDPVGDVFDGIFRAFEGLGDALSHLFEGFAAALDEGLPAGPADPQQQLVYAWHDKVIAPWMYRKGLLRKMSLAECEQFAARVFASYGYEGPKVVGVGGNQATGSYRLIEMPPHMQELGTLLHEVAHGLAQIFDPGGQSHGPGFVGFFLVLMQDYAGADRKWLLRTLRQYGIAHARIRRVPKRCAG